MLLSLDHVNLRERDLMHKIKAKYFLQFLGAEFQLPCCDNNCSWEPKLIRFPEQSYYAPVIKELVPL